MITPRSGPEGTFSLPGIWSFRKKGQNENLDSQPLRFKNLMTGLYLLNIKDQFFGFT